MNDYRYRLLKITGTFCMLFTVMPIVVMFWFRVWGWYAGYEVPSGDLMFYGMVIGFGLSVWLTIAIAGARGW